MSKLGGQLPAVGDHLVWLRNGLVRVVELKKSAGATFVIVEPLGWSGEPGWIPASALDLHLRKLVSAKTARSRLAKLREDVSHPPGMDLVARCKEYELTIDRGTADQQLLALARIYSEQHRPDPAELRVIETLERLVVGEIADVLGVPMTNLVTELHQRPRFAESAPASGEVDELSGAPPLPEGVDWLGSFEVESAVHLTDLDEVSSFVPARAGRWHALALNPEDDDFTAARWLAIAETHLDALPLARGDARLIAKSQSGSGWYAILDGTALDDPVIEELMMSHESVCLSGRGVVGSFHNHHAVAFRTWGDSHCFAVEMRTEPFDD